ncbi:MAG: 4Fe-4S binding protein [Candidatus Tenebribacter burtonii]|jgi:ferredoxin|nr:4Fe-4S binding protein [Candidatus Tenebribacter burtonii]
MKKFGLVSVIIILLILFISCDKVSDPEYHIDKSACSSCGACIGICPQDAIEIGKDGKAVIDQTKCNRCGKCIAVCPENAIY